MTAGMSAALRWARARFLRTQQRARPECVCATVVLYPPELACQSGVSRKGRCTSRCTRRRAGHPGRITSAPLASNHPETPARVVALDVSCPSGLTRQLLLRKEVIQPHLPVRLPCYDFVPIAGPTFDGSLPCGLGHRLRVLPTFVT